MGIKRYVDKRPCRIIYPYNNYNKLHLVGTHISVGYEFIDERGEVFIDEDPIVLSSEWTTDRKARKEYIREWKRILCDLEKDANVYMKEDTGFRLVNKKNGKD